MCIDPYYLHTHEAAQVSCVRKFVLKFFSSSIELLPSSDNLKAATTELASVVEAVISYSEFEVCSCFFVVVCFNGNLLKNLVRKFLENN